MQTRTTAQVQKASTPTMTPLKNTLLQRTCACGQIPGIDGLCSECRDKRLTSPHNSQHSSGLPTTPPLVQRKAGSLAQASTSAPNLSTNPNIGYNFSRVRIHAPAPEGMQAKLAVNQPGDVYEQEADQVAEQVMRMMTPGTSITPATPDDDESENDSLMRKQEGTTTAQESKDVPSIVHEVLRSEGGQPLDTATRSFMEPRFGHDFSRVRIHTDAQAVESARAVNALAYTVGRDVVFGREQYAPMTGEGRRLLAHELTHVVQQNKGGIEKIQCQQPPTSTETPPTAAPPAPVTTLLTTSSTPVGEEKTLHIRRVAVTVAPDKFDSGLNPEGAQYASQTIADLTWKSHLIWSDKTEKAVVTAAKLPTFKMTIQTIYYHGVTPEGSSAYGKGTSEEEKAQGKTTLRYHEGSHGMDFIQYLKDTPLPTYKGKKGMTRSQIEEVEAQFNRDMKAYYDAMMDFSTQRTDCVSGITIDDFDRAHNEHHSISILKCKK